MPEQKRGCGYRKVGGLYFIGDGLTFDCKSLPFPLSKCAICGVGIKFFRGFQWFESLSLTREMNPNNCFVGDCAILPWCLIRKMNTESGNKKVGLMWIGDGFYTPDQFIAEAKKQGVSKRISAIPKNFRIGEDWIFLAHKKAIDKEIVGDNGVEIEYSPGIFYAFKPNRVELVVTEEMRELDWVKTYEEKGVVPVVVEDDPRHRPARRKISKRRAYMDEISEAVDDEKS